MSKKFALLALAVCAALSLSGCGGSSKSPSVAITSSSSTVDGTDSVILTATVTNDKNSAGVSWTITSGGGALSNKTTTSATYTAPAATSSSQSITITATSVAKSTQTGTITITVPAMPTVTTNSANLTGAVGTAFSVTMQGSGGIPPYKNWAVSNAGSALPSCLTLSSSGVLTTTSGTAPTASCAGTYSNLIFTFTDSGTPTALPATSSPLSVVITSAPTITFTPTLPAGNVGAAYAGGVTASGGAGALTYALASGSLPPDLSLSATSGAITGTPKAADAGTANFTISASDAYGDTATSGPLSIAITAPTITFPTSLPGADVGKAYTGSVAATGPVGATTYTIASGSLGSDLSLDASTGAITGTPKASDAGTLTFTVKVVDAYGDTATSGTLTIAVTAPTITFPTSLPGGTVGTAYSASATATGPVGTTTYSLASGSLGSDLSLDASTGVISGTPKAADATTFSFTVKVVDAYGDTATSGSLSITIAAAPAISFGTAPAATATVSLAYSSALSATGGAGALTYSISSGSLPTGLNLDGNTGAITGTPTTVGSFTFTAKAQDSFGDTPATQSYTITVNPGSATHFAVTAVASATAGSPVSFIVTALDAGGNTATAYAGTVTFTSTDGQATLPANSTLISGTGTFPATLKTAGSQTITATDTGTPTITGTSGAITVNPGAAASLVVVAPASASTNSAFNFTVTAKDSFNNTATSYSGTVKFTSTDTSAVLPANSGLTNGTGTFPATLVTAGPQTITATDTTNSSITGMSGTITVSNTVTITTASMNPLDVGQAASQTLSASGGSGNSANYTWSWTGAPPGLSLSTAGAITGTPTTLGTYNVDVTVKDTGVTPNQTYSHTFTFTIYGSLSLPTPNPVSLPGGYVGVAYSGSVSGSGGSSTLSIAATSGLPADNLSATGAGSTLTIQSGSGGPTTAETVNFTAKLTDTTTGGSITANYSITIATPTPVTLPAPNPTSLPSATINQNYVGEIDASGGVPPYTWSINGTPVPSNGTQVSVSNGIYVYDNGGNALYVGGTPTATGTVSLPNVKVVDAATSNATQSYTITVNNAQNVSGQIIMDNSCGGAGTVPTISLTIVNQSGTPAFTQTTTTSDTAGDFSFTGVPDGNYTITPTYSSAPTGSSAMFYPAALNVTVNSSSSNYFTFNVSLGYTVSGTVTNSSSTSSGRIYLNLVNTCGASTSGTSISTAGSYTIHGVPPGSYTLEAWMDPSTLGAGAQNEADPTGTGNSTVTVVTNNQAGQDVTLNNSSVTNPTGNAGPTVKSIAPIDQGAIISYGYHSIVDSNGIEEYTSYTVQWATSTAGFSSSHQATFKAIGASSDVWFLHNGNSNMTGTLSNGTAYYFRVMGSNAAGNSLWNTSTSTITIGASTSGTNTVSGTITIPSSVTVNSGAVLYAGLYDQNANTAYAAVIANPVTGGAGNNFTVHVPSGSNYVLFGILDQNKDGLIDAGDVTNVNTGGSNPTVTISGNTSGENLTLPVGNTISAVQTTYFYGTYQTGSGAAYSLNFNLREGDKLPVAVQLVSGPYVITPVDIGNYCNGGCDQVQFQYYFNINSNVPSTSDAYKFNVTYSDGTTETVTVNPTNFGSTGAIAGAGGTNGIATNMLPQGTTGPSSGTRTTPTFSWTDPSNASSYTYGFALYDGNFNELWQIPSQNSNSNGFSSSITQIPWNTDPTGGGSLPSVGSLTSGQLYYWMIVVQDSNGNQTQTLVYYLP